MDDELKHRLVSMRIYSTELELNDYLKALNTGLVAKVQLIENGLK